MPSTTSYSPVYSPTDTTSTTSYYYYTPTTKSSTSSSSTHSVFPPSGNISTNTKSNNGSSRLSKGTIGGIIGGALAALILIIIGVIIYIKKKKEPPKKPIRFYHRTHSPIFEKGYTRILHLYGLPEGKNADAPLRGHLQVIKIGDPMTPRYTAMSYSWTRDNKDPVSDRDRELYLDIGKEVAQLAIFELTDASAEMMRSLRTTSDVALWIDQICIDQRDPQDFLEPPFENLDQQWQIPYMGEIYKNAITTTIWLGVEQEIPSQARIALQYVPALAKSHDTGSPPPDYKDVQDCLVALFTRMWFKRVWTFQELVKSRGKVVMVKVKASDNGEIMEMPWAITGAAGSYLHRDSSHPLPFKYLDNFEAITLKIQCWNAVEDRFPLLTILQLFRMFDVRWACDKLYGIQSIVDEAPKPTTPTLALPEKAFDEGPPLSVFSLPIPKNDHGWHIYHELAISLIERTKSLKILSAVEHIDHAMKSLMERGGRDVKADLAPSLPSWVPNWYQKAISLTFTDFRSNVPGFPFVMESFKACRLPHPSSAALTPSNDRRVLRVKGYFLSKISHALEREEGQSFEAAQSGDWHNLNPSLWTSIPLYLGISERDLDIDISLSTEVEDQRKLSAVRNVASFFTAGRNSKFHVLSSEFGNSDGSLLTYGEIEAEARKRIERIREHYLDFMAFRSLWNPEHRPLPRLHPKQERITRYARAAAGAHFCRKTFLMADGQVGIGPGTIDVAQGDEVFILQGAEVPFVLRPLRVSRGEYPAYRVIGECYCHSAMMGEAVEGIDQHDDRWGILDLL